MQTTSTTGLIGIDGGGSRCRFGLLLDGRRHETVLGPANATTDRAAAIEVIHEGLDKIARDAAVDTRDLCGFPAHIGLAGIMTEDDSRAVAAALPLRHATVTDDREISVAGALGRADGAVVGIGTGSFVARQHDGVMGFVGGWGLVLGDEAAGAWLGRELLSAVLRVCDRLIDPTDLTDEMYERFDADAANIVAFSRVATPRQFAELAPRVAAAAEAGDPMAVQLMQRGADYICAALNALNWRPAEALCLLGGLGQAYTPWLPDAAANAITAPAGSALDGALGLAAAAAAAGAGT